MMNNGMRFPSLGNVFPASATLASPPLTTTAAAAEMHPVLLPPATTTTMTTAQVTMNHPWMTTTAAAAALIAPPLPLLNSTTNVHPSPFAVGQVVESSKCTIVMQPKQRLLGNIYKILDRLVFLPDYWAKRINSLSRLCVCKNKNP
jgi:hypothetical protein